MNIVFVGIDTLYHRRLHPVLGWGGLGLLAIFTVLLFVASTAEWIAFGARLLS